MSLCPEDLICHSFMFEHEDGLLHRVDPMPAMGQTCTHWEHLRRVPTTRRESPSARQPYKQSYAWIREPDLNREEALKIASSDIVPWVTYYPYAIS